MSAGAGGRAWRVVATSRFDRDLARLPPRVAAAIVEFATAVLPQNPSRMTKPLTGDLEGYRSARRGDYRVIVRLDDAAQVVVLHRVAHRTRLSAALRADREGGPGALPRFNDPDAAARP